MRPKGNDIEVLVISDLYPRPDSPVRGVFVRDHARALFPFVEKLCVANIELQGRAPVLQTDEREPGIDLLQGGVFRNAPPSFLRPFLYPYWAQKAMERILAHTDPALVHAHGSVLSGTLARRIARRKGIPYFITEHFRMVEDWVRDPLKKGLLKRNYREASEVIGVSRDLSAKIRASFPWLKVRTLPNPVDTELFGLSAEERGKRILFAARLDPNKGGLRLLKAFSTLYRDHPDWELRILGEGKEGAAIAALLDQDPALKERVYWRASNTREELAEEMQRAAFLVLPSEYESFGLVIAESLSCGTPVIAPDRSGPSDIMFGGAGERIDPLDHEALKGAMRRMIRQYGTFDRERMHERVKARFGMQKFGGELWELYEKQLDHV